MEEKNPKRPSFQFYPGDWLQDSALQSVSVGARGLWIQMICLMHQGSVYGYLMINHKPILPVNLARMVGASVIEVEGWMTELEGAGVFTKDECDCIYSRRMIRDEQLRKTRAAGGFLGGNPALKKVGDKVNLFLTPSSSSSSSKPSESVVTGFDAFWSIYPKKKAKGQAMKAWRKIKPDDTLLRKILFAVNAQKTSADWRKDEGQFIPHPATWLNQGRWEDDVGPVVSEKKKITGRGYSL